MISQYAFAYALAILALTTLSTSLPVKRTYWLTSCGRPYENSWISFDLSGDLKSLYHNINDLHKQLHNVKNDHNLEISAPNFHQWFKSKDYMNHDIEHVLKYAVPKIYEDFQYYAVYIDILRRRFSGDERKLEIIQPLPKILSEILCRADFLTKKYAPHHKINHLVHISDDFLDQIKLSTTFAEMSYWSSVEGLKSLAHETHRLLKIHLQ